jgi:hypothetical protein
MKKKTSKISVGNNINMLNNIMHETEKKKMMHGGFIKSKKK